MQKPPIDKVAWLPLKDRKVLFARSHGQALFYCVGGKRDGNETDEETLAREILEEVDVVIALPTVRHLHTFVGSAHNDPTRELRMACYAAEGDGEPKASSEIAELKWLSSADAPRTTETGRAVLLWLKERDLID